MPALTARNSAIRKNRVSASDAPILFPEFWGNDYRTGEPKSHHFGRDLGSLYLVKAHGIEQKPDAAAEERMKWGVLMEPIVRADFVERWNAGDFSHVSRDGIGEKINLRANSITMASKTHPDFCATIDNRALKTPKVTIAEIKNVSRFQEPDWQNPKTGGLPAKYVIIQVAQQMLVTKAEIALVLALVDSSALWVYRIEKNDNIEMIQEEILRRGAEFLKIARAKAWEEIPFSATSYWRQIMGAEYEIVKDKIEATPEIAQAVAEARELSDLETKCNARREQISDMLAVFARGQKFIFKGGDKLATLYRHHSSGKMVVRTF